MGNCCSNINQKNQVVVSEMHIQEFQRTFKPLRFPAIFTFTHDPDLFRIRNCVTNDQYILKRVSFKKNEDLAAFVKSLNNAIQLDHDNLLKIHCYAIENVHIKDLEFNFVVNIVLEPFEQTLQEEICDRASKSKQYTDAEIKEFMNSLANALEFLQLKGNYIGDLRPSKIYLTPEKKPKLMFIGEINHADGTPTTVDPECQDYLSPQLRNQTPDIYFPDKMTPIGSPIAIMHASWNPFKAAVYSFGLILVDMMSIKGFNQPNLNSTNRRDHRTIQWDGPYCFLVCNVLKAMLSPTEMFRPDFIELKKLLLEEEYEESRSETKDSTVLQMEILRLINGKSSLATKTEKIGNASSTSSADQSPIKLLVTPPPAGQRYNFDQVPDNISEEVEEAGDPVEAIVEGLKDVLELCEQKVSTIRKLAINLDEEELSTEDITKISEFIGMQKDMNELAMAIPKANLQDVGLEILCKGMETLEEIALCYFDFSDSKITDKGVKVLGKCILKKKKLVLMTINLSCNEVTDAGCLEVSRWFGEFKNVKSLALNFGGNRIKTEGVAAIGKELPKMEEIEAFTIFVYSNDIEGKTGIVELVNGIKQLKKLKEIKLNLVENFVGDKEMEVILAFLMETEIEEVVVHINDNEVSEEMKKKVKTQCAGKSNVMVRI